MVHNVHMAKQESLLTGEGGRLVVYVGPELKARLQRRAADRSVESGYPMSLGEYIRELLAEELGMSPRPPRKRKGRPSVRYGRRSGKLAVVPDGTPQPAARMDGRSLVPRPQNISFSGLEIAVEPFECVRAAKTGAPRVALRRDDARMAELLLHEPHRRVA